jgi:carbonic anhydrase
LTIFRLNSGTENWHKVHECWLLCKEDDGRVGSRQSPIDIETEEATLNRSLTFNFSNVDTRVKAEYQNCGNGKTLELLGTTSKHQCRIKN